MLFKEKLDQLNKELKRVMESNGMELYGLEFMGTAGHPGIATCMMNFESPFAVNTLVEDQRVVEARLFDAFRSMRDFCDDAMEKLDGGKDELWKR